jgi:hypothetical protein
VTGNGGVVLVIDRTGLEDRLCGPENLLHAPKFAICEGHRECVELAVGAQNVEPIEAGILGDAVGIDLEVVIARGGEGRSAQ